MLRLSRRFIAASMLCLIAPALLGANQTKPAALTQDEQEDLAIEQALNSPGYVVILGTSKDFPTLKRRAQAIARAAGLPFSLEGMSYSTKLGLHYPHDAGPWADGYVFRREDTMTLHSGKESHFVSIEMSDAYPGLKKGYFLIVGGICFSPKDVKKELALYKAAVADAYAPKTTIYVGCME